MYAAEEAHRLHRRFLRKLAALVPPPRGHLVRFHGVFAPHSSFRRKVIPVPEAATASADPATPSQEPPSRIPGAELFKRVFKEDVLRCAKCGGAMKVIAFVREREATARSSITSACPGPGHQSPRPGAQATPTTLPEPAHRTPRTDWRDHSPKSGSAARSRILRSRGRLFQSDSERARGSCERATIDAARSQPRLDRPAESLTLDAARAHRAGVRRTRLAFPSRLELKSLAGSFKEAPLKKVSFTIDLYDSPVQMPPSWDHIGVPIHFHSSTTSGTASLIRARILASVSPLQSPNSAILSLIRLEAALPAAFG